MLRQPQYKNADSPAARGSARLSNDLASLSTDSVTVTFDARSTCGRETRRELVIEAGKSHKFTIPQDEMPR